MNGLGDWLELSVHSPFIQNKPTFSLWVTWSSESRLTSLCMVGTQRPRWNGWEEIHTALEIRSIPCTSHLSWQLQSQEQSVVPNQQVRQQFEIHLRLLHWWILSSHIAVAAFIPCHTAKLCNSLNILFLLIQLLLFVFTVEMFHTSVFIALRIWCLYPSLAYFTDFFFQLCYKNNSAVRRWVFERSWSLNDFCASHSSSFQRKLEEVVVAECHREKLKDPLPGTTVISKHKILVYHRLSSLFSVCCLAP